MLEFNIEQAYGAELAFRRLKELIDLMPAKHCLTFAEISELLDGQVELYAKAQEELIKKMEVVTNGKY